MIDFATLQGLSIPEGVVTKIESGGVVLWQVKDNSKVVLEVEKITSNTYAGETTYNNEQFILLDIYPKTNGTVKVTYGGLTKTITDTSGVAEPNAQKVFFGTFNGVSDSVTTPASGTLTIEGDCRGFGQSQYSTSKVGPAYCVCILAISNWGSVDFIPETAFTGRKLTSVTIPENIMSIGDLAFLYVEGYVRTVIMLSKTPPTLLGSNVFYPVGTNHITVPKGCGATYKTAEYWSQYADYIVEAS
jgi:hypothetical protein